MITVTVTLDDSHKTSAGYIYMLGDDKIFTSEKTFSFVLESTEDFCNVIQSKIGDIEYTILEFKHIK